MSPPLPGDVSQPILGRADTTAPGHISQPLPGQAGRARPLAGSSPVRGTGSVPVPERAIAAASVPAAAVPPHVEDRPAPGATGPLDRTGAVVRPAAAAEPDDEAEAVPGEIGGGRSEWGKQLRAKRRLRVITLVTLSVLVLGLLPLFFGIRAATRDPVFNSLDALDVPGWAATEIDDRSSGSRWCFLDCRFRERTAQSDRPFEETAKVYSDALIIAGWKPWQVGACPEQPVTDGRYTCWRRDEFTLDLWVRLPECAVDAFAAQDPATLPSTGPDGVVETAKPESCVGSTVSIKVQNAITDQRGKPEQPPNPSLVGETPDPVLSNDPLLDPTPSPS